MPRKKKLSGDALRKVNKRRAHETALTWAHIALRDTLKENGVPAIEAIRITLNTATLMAGPVAGAAIEARRSNSSSIGGQATAKAKKAAAAPWHDKCVTKARALLAQGRSPRELAGILAKTFGITSRQVNNVLKKAEVK